MQCQSIYGSREFVSMVTHFGVPALVAAACLAFVATRWLGAEPEATLVGRATAPRGAPTGRTVGIVRANWEADDAGYIPARERALLSGEARERAEQIARDADVQSELERLEAAGTPVQTSFVRPVDDQPGLLAVE